MEFAYITLSDKQLYVNLDKLLEGPKAILAPLQNYLGAGVGGGGGWPLLPPCSYAFMKNKYLIFQEPSNKSIIE